MYAAALLKRSDSNDASDDFANAGDEANFSRRAIEATVIQVIEGPDQGAAFELPTDSVRLGVGTAVDFRLADPQLRGTLLVEWKNGTYHVRNDLDFAIYLDHKILSRGESRVWYDDTILQPTAQTQLVLQHRDSSDSTQAAERLNAAGRPVVSNSSGTISRSDTH